jgi:hypothetical protein
MKRRKKIFLAFVILGIAFISIFVWLWNLPHRNVAAANADESISVAELTRLFLANPATANAHYLSSDGNSKILQVEGPVFSITTNSQAEPVVLIKADSAKMGVLASFQRDQADAVRALKKGDLIEVKGAITSGNSYDADLDLYEHVSLIQSVLRPMKTH